MPLWSECLPVGSAVAERSPRRKVETRELVRREIHDVWSLDRSERIEGLYRREGDRSILEPEDLHLVLDLPA